MLLPFENMKFNGVLTSVITLILASASSCKAESSRKPASAQWELIAQSDLVARGQLSVPVAAIRRSIQSKKYYYVDLKVRVVEAYKGAKSDTPLTVRYYTEPKSYSPDASTLFAVNQKDVFVFLLKVDNPGIAGYYCAGYTPNAISKFKSEDESLLKKEIEVQKKIAVDFESLDVGKADSSDKSVRQLLDQLTKSSTQKAAWEKLLELPKSALPAVIRAMKDQRALGNSYAYIPNPPGFFESIAQYGPGCVLDAAAILLNYKTGTSFHQTINGGTEREREAEVNGWRVWSYYHAGNQNRRSAN